MAYASGSLNLAIPRVGGGDDVGSLSSALFIYRSADPALTVIGAGYIDDGNDKGMKVGDGVLVCDDGAAMTSHIVTVVTAAGLVTLSAHVVL